MSSTTYQERFPKGFWVTDGPNLKTNKFQSTMFESSAAVAEFEIGYALSGEGVNFRLNSNMVEHSLPKETLLELVEHSYDFKLEKYGDIYLTLVTDKDIAIIGDCYYEDCQRVLVANAESNDIEELVKLMEILKGLGYTVSEVEVKPKISNWM